MYSALIKCFQMSQLSGTLITGKVKCCFSSVWLQKINTLKHFMSGEKKTEVYSHILILQELCQVFNGLSLE